MTTSIVRLLFGLLFISSISVNANETAEDVRRELDTAWTKPPTQQPVPDPTSLPTFAPTPTPTRAPVLPTLSPTLAPSGSPSLSSEPSSAPTPAPTFCSESYLTSENLNIALVVDLSYSTFEKEFSSLVDIDDVNGDGKGNTILDAQIVAIQDLLKNIAESPTLTNENCEIQLIAFETDAKDHGKWMPLNESGDDYNPELMTYIKETLRAPTSTTDIWNTNNGYTNFDGALDLSVDYFENSATPDRKNLLIFMSDGEPNVRGDGDSEGYCTNTTKFWNGDDTELDCSDLGLELGERHEICRGDDETCVEFQPYQDCVRGPNECLNADAATQYESELAALDLLLVERLAIGIGDESNVKKYSALWMIDNNPGKALDVLPLQALSLEELSMYLSSLCILNTDPPTGSPSASPTGTPSSSPSTPPSKSPTSAPTGAPSSSPTATVTSAPSNTPTVSPSGNPTGNPSGRPTGSPTASPSSAPSTDVPSASPTSSPTTSPSTNPTDIPITGSPTGSPTASPSSAPSTDAPSASPTSTPTTSPSTNPTDIPITGSPTLAPTAEPTAKLTQLREPSPDDDGPVFPPTPECPEDIQIISHEGYTDLPDRAVRIVSQDSTSVTVQLVQAYTDSSEAIGSWYYQYKQNSFNEKCFGDEDVTGDAIEEITIQCFHTNQVAVLELWISDDINNGVLGEGDTAVIPNCCHPSEPSGTPATKYVLKIECETQCPDAVE